MRLVALLFIIATILYSNVGAQNPLGPCSGGRGVPIVPTSSGGACGFPSLPGIITANVNQAFFDNGAKCGECYQVTGPLGTVTVMVTDMCSEDAPKCGGDKDNFGIANSGYFQIANSTTDIIYDLGYRLVTCDVPDIQIQIGSDSNNYYFSATVYNYKVGLSGVGVKGSGWSGFEPLTRRTNSAVWNWNKASNTLSFPLTLSLVGITGEVLQYQVSSWTAGSVLNTGIQFSDAPAGNGLCPLAAPPQYIYSDNVTYGWDTSFSFNYDSLNTADSSTSVSGTSISVEMFAYGGLQFTRDGGFDPTYFSTLQFSAKANGQSPLRVYLGALASGQAGGSTVTVTTDWQLFNISLTDLQATDVEFDIVFQNFQDNTMQYWFDNVMFSYAPISPIANITYTDPTTVKINTTDPGSVGGSGLASTTQINFDPNSEGENGPTGSASSASFSALFIILSVLVASLL